MDESTCRSALWLHYETYSVLATKKKPTLKQISFFWINETIRSHFQVVRVAASFLLFLELPKSN